MALQPDSELEQLALALAVRNRSWNTDPSKNEIAKLDGLLRKRFADADVAVALADASITDSAGTRALLRLAADMAETPKPGQALAHGARFLAAVGKLLTFAPVVATSRGGFSGVAPKNFKRTDEHIFDDVADSLTRHPEIDASALEVKVKDGVVILSGKAPDRRTKWLAEQVCADSSGVVDVENRIRVGLQ